MTGRAGEWGAKRGNASLRPRLRATWATRDPFMYHRKGFPMLSRRRIAFSCIFAVLLVAAPAYGGIISYEGTESCIWANRCLIVAKVLKTERDRTATKYYGLQYYVTLDPTLTLAGSFDCAAARELKIPIVLGPFGSPLFAPPPAGSLVLIHLELANEGYFVPGLAATYMPENLPVWEVWGLHDEVLLKIVSTVGERRREGARLDRDRRADCTAWLNDTYPKHTQFLIRPIDKSFEARNIALVRVKSVAAPEKNGDRKVSLRLIGVAAGRLDPALLGEVEVFIPAKLVVGRKVPTIDAEMFVALDECDGKYLVPKEELDYLPSRWAFSHVETSVDVTCDKILAKLRERAASKETNDDVGPKQRP